MTAPPTPPSTGQAGPKLAPLLISVGPNTLAEPGGKDCAYCGNPLGLHAGEDGACAVCTPVLHLDRPRIDEEARLAWMPEMTQAAMSCLIREIHCQLWVANESSSVGAGSNQAAVHFARQALDARAELAILHLGTDRPSELAQALGLLRPDIYAQRHRVLAGLRVLPAGRFFVGTEDVYPAILASWCAAECVRTSGGTA